MGPKYHIAVSAAVAAGVYSQSKSVPAALVSLVVGVLNDVDHAIDFYAQHGLKKRISLERIYFAYRQSRAGGGEYWMRRLFLLFHITELAILLAVAAFWTGNSLIVGVAVSYGLHICMDYYNLVQIIPPNKFSRVWTHYFLLWRLGGRFDSDVFYLRKPWRPW